MVTAQGWTWDATVLYLIENKIIRTAASVSEALSSEGKIRRALAALQFRKLQEVMCILNISLNSQNLFLVENSVADPYIWIRTDPHLKSPPGSGSAWTDADPDQGGKKA